MKELLKKISAFVDDVEKYRDEAHATCELLAKDVASVKAKEDELTKKIKIVDSKLATIGDCESILAIRDSVNAASIAINKKKDELKKEELDNKNYFTGLKLQLESLKRQVDNDRAALNKAKEEFELEKVNFKKKLTEEFVKNIKA